MIKLKQELRERDLLLQGDKGELVQRLCTIMMKEHKRKEFQDQCMTTDETGFLERLRNPAVLFPGDMGKIVRIYVSVRGGCYELNVILEYCVRARCTYVLYRGSSASLSYSIPSFTT